VFHCTVVIFIIFSTRVVVLPFVYDIVMKTELLNALLHMSGAFKHIIPKNVILLVECTLYLYV